MITLILILGVLFLSICIYQLNKIKEDKISSGKQKRWISVIMALFALPMLKLLDRILENFGLGSDFAFYGSILIILFATFAFKWVTSMQFKNS